MQTALLLVLLSACTSAGDSGAPPDGLLEAGIWGDDTHRLDIADDGSATLAGGCAHATLDAATIADGAFDWTLAWTDEVAYVDTGDHSYPVGWSGTISGDSLDGTLDFGSGNTSAISLTRGVETEVDTCD